MLVASWHPVPCPAGVRMTFATHFHGRDAQVSVAEGSYWSRWRVASATGHLLAEGDAPDRDSAEQAAEDEVCAVHPPTAHLMDELLSWGCRSSAEEPGTPPRRPPGATSRQWGCS